MVYLFLRVLTGAFSTLLALCGFAPRTMWRAPLLTSTSVSDFWSRRWNLLIHGLFRRTVFSPLTRRGVPAWAAGALAFAISGLFHEYAFALQQPSLRESLGRCLLFFLAQAPAVSAEVHALQACARDSGAQGYNRPTYKIGNNLGAQKQILSIEIYSSKYFFGPQEHFLGVRIARKQGL